MKTFPVQCRREKSRFGVTLLFVDKHFNRHSLLDDELRSPLQGEESLLSQ